MLNGELELAPYGFRVLPTAEAVSEARRHVIAVARRWPVEMAEEAISNLELLAGEVIANAVAHSGASCAVCVRWTGTRVRLEVTDTDSGMPSIGHAAPDDESGRGMLLVDALSAEWGAKPDPAGKVVWFEIETDTAPADVRRLAPGRTVLLPAGARLLATPADRREVRPWPRYARLVISPSWLRLVGG